LTYAIENDNGEKELFSGCPWKRIPRLALAQFCVNLFVHYRNGFLPGPGGIADQPHWLVQALSILSNEYSEMESEKQERQNQALNRGLGR
jgi:hypothetical protein